MTTSSSRKRSRFKGRKDHSFLALPHYMLESAEFEALSGNAVKLLIDLAKRYRGSNNGDFSMAWSSLSKHGWSSQGTVNRAKKELLAAEFIVCTRHGGKNRCSLYGITWKPLDELGAKTECRGESVATNRWRKHEPCSGSGAN